MYRYKNSIFQSPLIVYGIFGQLSMILTEISFCLGSYLTVNIQPFAPLGVKTGRYIFSFKCMNS